MKARTVSPPTALSTRRPKRSDTGAGVRKGGSSMGYFNKQPIAKIDCCAVFSG